MWQYFWPHTVHGVQVNIWKLCKITMQGQILLLDLFICYCPSFFVAKTNQYEIKCM